MLVSTCSNLNIIQIEKNHTKTPRGIITKIGFFLSREGGILIWNLDYRINCTGIKNKLNDKKKTDYKNRYLLIKQHMYRTCCWERHRHLLVLLYLIVRTFNGGLSTFLYRRRIATTHAFYGRRGNSNFCFEEHMAYQQVES